MAITVSSYRNIPTSGVIPSDMTPADVWSVAYEFSYTKTYNPLEGLDFILKADLTIEVLSSVGDLKYTLTIHEEYNIIAAIGLWFWNDNAEKFTATDANGDPLNEVDGGALSAGVIPASGDFGIGTATVDSRFFGPLVESELLPGDTIKITFHDVSEGTVIDQASLQLATELGGGLTEHDVVTYGPGDSYLQGRNLSIGVAVVRADVDYQQAQHLSKIDTGAFPSVNHFNGGNVGVMASLSRGVRSYESQDAGLTRDLGLTVIGGNAAMPREVNLGNDTTGVGTVAGNTLEYRTSADDYQSSRYAGYIPASEPYAPTQDSSGVVRLSNNNGRVRVSEDGGLTYKYQS